MKRKIMLINPFFEEGFKGFPLGLAYIGGALRDKYEIIAVDLTARATLEERKPDEILIEELRKHSPDIVGISSVSSNHKSALEAARLVKRIKNIPVIKGGPHETNCAESTISNNPEIDYSVVGEGENTIVELVDAILNGKSVSNIKGIVYRENNQAIKTGRRKLIQALDTLPRPARDLFYTSKSLNEYYSASLFEGKKSTSITASRGCPYSCTFCSSKASWGRLRQRSVGDVMLELEELYSLGFRGFMFEDDMSLANKEWFLEFAKKIKESNMDIEYSIQTRVDAIDEDIAKALSESGCKFMYFGIESGVQHILDNCNKGITMGQARDAFQVAKRYGIRSMASIQFGLPGEDLENLTTVSETIRVLNEELMPEEVAISYTCLYPGSPLAVQERVTPEMYEHYVRTKSDGEIYGKTAHGSYAIHPKGLTPKKIREIEGVIRRELRVKRFEVTTFYS